LLPPVTEQKLRRQMFDALVTYIVGSQLRPGHQLPSTASLCEQFNASRSVVREALSALEAVGLVEISNGRNAVVRELDGHLISLFLARALQDDDRPLLSLMEVRGPLEVQAAGLAAARATEADREAISEVLARMDEAVGDAALYPRLDVDFHSTIARAGRNSALIWTTQAFGAKLVESMERMHGYRASHQLVGQEHEEHRAIADAILAGDVEAARASMRRHMRSSLDMVHAIGAQDAELDDRP